MQNAWILSIGTELTLGQSVDTNSAWLATQLAALGIRTQRHVTVADELAPIRAALLEAAEACDLILVSGGLGPTDDDLTRQALADAAGVALELHEPSLAALRAFFRSRHRDMPQRNEVQAYLPRTARAIANTCGTAPGIAMRLRGTPVYVVPGVPFEMRTMFTHDIEPELRAATSGRVLLMRHLHTFGLGESSLGEQMRDLMQRGRNPEVGTTAELGIIGIRINATGPTAEAARKMLDETETEIRQRFRTVVFGRDGETLAGVVGQLLTARRQTVATAESCTGGLIGAALTDTPGSSNYYLGGVVSYANAAKTALLDVPPALLQQHGAVSAPVAQAMAEGVARRLGSDYALSVTGIAGPAGGSAAKPVGLVYVGVRTPAGTTVHELHLGSDAPRDVIRTRAARTALNLLRLALLGGPAQGDKAPAACGR
jgi:nicotinamide-nucleotide amidase